MPLLFSKKSLLYTRGGLLGSCRVATKDLGFTGTAATSLRHLHISPPHPTSQKNLGLSFFTLSPGTAENKRDCRVDHDITARFLERTRKASENVMLVQG
jgi:hypothetical protein